MNISLNIILDGLDEYQIESHLQLPSEKSFRRLELFHMSMLSRLKSDVLYFCNLSMALTIPAEKRRTATMVCMRDRFKDGVETPELMENLVVINENLSFEQMFSTVQGIFVNLNQWYMDAQEALIKSCPLQELIDISEPILGNYLQITDSSFNLLGFTGNTECDEEMTIQCRQLGYHPESTIKLFSKYRRMEQWERNSGIFINDNCDMCKYPLISKIYKFSNTYFAHVVLVCCNHPANSGMVDLFELFTELLAVFMEKEWKSTNNCYHTYDAFLSDLYEGHITRKDIAEDRARRVGISLEGNYCLTISCRDESGQVSLSNVMQDILMARPQDRVVNLHGRIIVLSLLNGRNIFEQMDVLQADMKSVMEKFDLRCGMSGVFENLLEAADAIKQAERALSFSGRTPGSELLPVLEGGMNGLSDRAIRFEESFYYALLGNGPESREIWHSSVFYEALKKLDAYDKRHGQNNLQLLYVYLVNESRSTDTAAALFMSRNNVVYRTDRIQDLLNLDLKNASVRFKLLISYVMMQLYGLD